METSDFIFSIIHSLNDPKWAKYVEEIGIDEVTIQLYYDRVKNVAIEWAEYQGYDVNDLLATAALYSQSSSSPFIYYLLFIFLLLFVILFIFI